MNWRWMQFLVELHKEVNKAVWWKIHDESYIRNDAWFPLVYINLIQPVHPKGNQSWIFIGRTDAEPETPILWPPDEKTHLKRPWCWERLRVGEGGERGWDGWMASVTQWTWVWVSSRNWWWTRKPGVLQSMGSQRIKHDWVTELNWTELSGDIRKS